MKKLSILLAGLMAMAVVSCDEAPVEPPMPSNPQEPIMQGGNVAVQAAGFLAEQTPLALTADANDDLLFVEFTSVENLPAGAKVSANLEISANADFAGATVVEGAVRDDVQVVVPAAALVKFQTDHFGQTPEPQKIYYRIPLYVEQDGVAYRLVPEGETADYCYLTGEYMQSYNAGYTIDDVWYIVVDGVKTQLEHSAASVYNDHHFFATMEVNGGAKWHVESASGVAYGPQDDGDTFDNGVLLVNANNCEIEVDSKYAFAFELKVDKTGVTSVLYNFSDASVNPGAPTGVYLRGGFDPNWAALIEYEFVETDQTGVYALLGVAIKAGTEFKVADAKWADINCGAAGDEPLEVGVDYALGAGGGNLKLDEDFYGNVFFTDINGQQSLRLFSLGASAGAGEAVDIYLRGGFDSSWAALPAYQFKTTEVEGVYMTDVVDIAANIEFKVADPTWGSVNYGASDVPFAEVNQYELAYNGGNLTMDVDFHGQVKLVVYDGKYYVRFFEVAATEE